MLQQVTTDLSSGVWRLVADIGGTNARFGLASVANGGQSQVEEIRSLSCVHFPSIEDVIDAYLASLPGTRQAAIQEACIAIAGPTENEMVNVTNLSWTFSKAATGKRFGFRRFAVINDFAALALSCTQLDSEYLERIDTTGEFDDSAAEAPRVVVGPGTGLGVCGLRKSTSGWEALPGEGGHAALAPVTEEEFSLLQFLRKGQHHVSAEDLLSGRGLENIYRGLGAVRGVRCKTEGAAGISAAALAEDCMLARDSVLTFCNLLGGFCGDVALVLGARGAVYLGGGILPRIKPLLLASDFEQRLRAKGPMSGYLEKLPVFLVSHPFPALSGAAAYLSLDG